MIFYLLPPEVKQWMHENVGEWYKRKNSPKNWRASS